MIVISVFWYAILCSSHLEIYHMDSVILGLLETSLKFRQWVLIFVSGTRLTGFISSTTRFSRWPGQEQENQSPVIFPEKAMQMSGICFEVKFCFGYFHCYAVQ